MDNISSFCSLLSVDDETKEVSCEVPIPLASHTNAKEYVAHMVSTQGVHDMFREELLDTLETFIRNEEERLEEERDEDVIECALKEGKEVDIDGWKDIVEGTSSDSLDEAMALAEFFSYVMRECEPWRVQAMVNREEEMAAEITSLIKLRDTELEKLREKTEELMADNEEDPHALCSLSDEMRNVHESYVAELRMVGERQRREFKDMVCRLRNDSQYIPRSIGSHLSEDADVKKKEEDEGVWRREESFTIYLGAQLKTMHNARIVMGEGLEEGNTNDATHLRLQAAMGLYRRELNAIVVLVGRDIKWHLTRHSKLSRLCERSTELQFDPLEVQLERIAETARKVNRERKPKEGMRDSMNDWNLSVGDVYCTRHSNIGSVQIVFHLVVDETEEKTDMNSRNPCLNGVRNMIRLCSRFGVSTLSLPLLLIHSMDEKSTSVWCTRRAELVFKCVKGFLMEICSTGWSSVSHGGPSLSRAPHYNINFLLPHNVSDDIYSQIVSIFPTIFHLVPSVSL